MAWKEFNKDKLAANAGKAVDVADKGLSLIDNIATIFSAIKWIIIAVLLGFVIWIGVGIKNSIEDSSEAVQQTVIDTKKAAVEVKDASIENTKKAYIASKDAVVAAAQSETAQNIRNEVADVKENIVHSEEFQDAKEKAGAVITDKIGGWFKKKEEPVDKKVESEDNTGES